MIQRMRNLVVITVEDIDLTTVTDIEVELIQESTGVERLFSGGEVVVVDDSKLSIDLPKDFCMQLDVEPLRAQVMFTRDTGLPDATKPFAVPVRELLKEAGYGY